MTQVLTIDEAAKIAKLNPFTLSRMIREGRGPAHVRIGGGSNIRIRAEDLDRWLSRLNRSLLEVVSTPKTRSPRRTKELARPPLRGEPGQESTMAVNYTIAVWRARRGDPKCKYFTEYGRQCIRSLPIGPMLLLAFFCDYVPAKTAEDTSGNMGEEWDNWEPGSKIMSYDQIGERLNVSRRSIVKWSMLLKAYGLLRIEHRYCENGRDRNKFTVLPGVKP